MQPDLKLNEAQQNAVTHKDGPLLVLAGAGSGKTRVVTQRIVQLIHNGVEPSQILGLTFTNKAAGEMNERVRSLTSFQVLISTFHSLGARILRESIQHLGYKNDYTIYDAEDSEKLIREIVKQFQITKKGDIKELKTLISNAKNNMEAPGEVTADGNSDAAYVFPSVYTLYEERLKESNALDFDDLLYLPVKLFDQNPEVLKLYQDRWQYLLIDEFQDTNQAQFTLVQQLTGERQNICVVGDPDQSIYSWRGATIENILRFQKYYPEVNIVRLEQNYRSTETILEASNALILNNESRYEKNLWSDLGEGEKIYHFAAETDREEAEFIVAEIKKLQSMGVSISDMVVFYRTNFQSRIFEDYLIMNHIPYTIVGGISFYHRREVKDLLSFLRMAQTDADTLAFTRSLNLPKRGMGAKTQEKIRTSAREHQMTIYTYVKYVADDPAFAKLEKYTAKQVKALQEYIHTIDHLRTIAQTGTLAELVTAAIHDTGYLDTLREEPETYDDRKSNLEELVTKAVVWQSEEGDDRGLDTFLAELVLKSTLDETPENQEHLTLMTIHNGKGLEFKAVFLVGMEQDLFPHINSSASPEQVEEERRLCYVGLTRAREKLYLTRSRTRFLWGTARWMLPSPFLKEIPKKFMIEIS